MTLTLPSFAKFKAVSFAAVLGASVALSGCSTNPATGKQSFTAFMSAEDELKVGSEEHPKILKQFGGVYDNIELSAYVAGIGSRLVKASELPDLQFRFTVLNDTGINAFALPGGYVYVTRGLIAMAENEAELAGVLAHEIGHVTARHTAERYSKEKVANFGLTFLSILGSLYGAPREAAQALSSGAESILKGFSREQEFEADMLGVRYISRIGYTPDGMTSFFQKLKGHDELQAAMADRPTSEESFTRRSSHPRTTDRIKQAIKLAQESTVQDPMIERDRYLSKIDGMIFGDTLEQGIRRGKTFLHPDLKIKFTVPDGFYLINTPTRVIAKHSNQSAILFEMDESPKASRVTDLRGYLMQEWGANIDLKNPEHINVNGMNAWTANLQSNSKSGPRDIRLVAIQGDDQKIFKLTFITPVSEVIAMSSDLRRMTYSFKRLTTQEAIAIKPLRIKVVTSKQSDTPESLSNNMGMEEFNLGWLRLLNSNEDLADLPTGTKVKVIDGY